MDSMGYPMGSAGTKRYFSNVTDGQTSLSGIIATGHRRCRRVQFDAGRIELR